MYLLLNTLSPLATALLYENGRILHRVEWDSRLREYDTLLPELDRLYALAGVSSADLAGIVCVNGPGSFTGMRTVVLTVNAIAYARGISVMPIDLFELGDLLGWPYPRILTINTRETGIRASRDSGMELVANDLVPAGRYWGYSQMGSQNPEIMVESPEPYERLVSEIVFRGVPRITPLYVKRPNITVSPDLRRRIRVLE